MSTEVSKMFAPPTFTDTPAQTEYKKKPRCTTPCVPVPFTAKDGREFKKCSVCENLVFEHKNDPNTCAHDNTIIRTSNKNNENFGREFETCPDCGKFNWVGPPKRKAELISQEAPRDDELWTRVLALEQQLQKFVAEKKQ